MKGRLPIDDNTGIHVRNTLLSSDILISQRAPLSCLRDQAEHMAKPKTAIKLMGTIQWAVPSRSGGRNTKTNDDRERRFTTGDGRII
jgi:hypothetical protein